MYCTYILASKPLGILYIGVTSNLIKRVWEHKQKTTEGFTAKYHVDKLVYFEQYEDIINAIKRERCLKEWQREWKIALIAKENPEWKDLYYEIIK